jgi:hypothetical protein
MHYEARTRIVHQHQDLLRSFASVLRLQTLDGWSDSKRHINDNNQANNYMDLDFGLLDNYDMDDYVPDTIDWEQWDVWLADSNVMRSSS